METIKMSKQQMLKIAPEDVATFRALGKPHGAKRNLTDGVRAAVERWTAAGKPELPPDPWVKQYGVHLLPVVSRWGATWDALVEAGDGKGTGAGARRLAAWIGGLRTC